MRIVSTSKECQCRVRPLGVILRGVRETVWGINPTRLAIIVGQKLWKVHLNPAGKLHVSLLKKSYSAFLYPVPLNFSSIGPWQALEQITRRRSITFALTKLPLPWHRMRTSLRTWPWLVGSMSLFNKLTRCVRASELLSLKEFPTVRKISATIPILFTLTSAAPLILLICSATSLDDVLMARNTCKDGNVVWYSLRQSNSWGREGSSNWTLQH